jgi:hypothetical protein
MSGTAAASPVAVTVSERVGSAALTTPPTGRHARQLASHQAAMRLFGLYFKTIAPSIRADASMDRDRGHIMARAGKRFHQ